MLVIGYNRTQQYFLLKNSWGGNSYVKVSYEFIQKASQGGTIITEVVDPNASPQTKGLWLGRWNMDHDGWRGTLVVRRITNVSNQRTRLGSYYGNNGSSHTVNGVFNEQDRLMDFSINFNIAETPPGNTSGQKFKTYLYSWDKIWAAGSTTLDRRPFGVVISRNVIPRRRYLNPFDKMQWKGTWNMNHDGWRGVLKINNVVPNPWFITINGTYTKDGTTYTVSGTLNKQQPYRATLYIDFPGNRQKFVLYHFSWEKGIYAGYTYWGGREFGAYGLK